MKGRMDNGLASYLACLVRKVGICLLLLASSWAKAQYPAGSPVAVNGKLQVIGAHLRNQCGNPIQLRGMGSHGVHWFGHCITPASLDALVKDWDIDVLRLAMYVQEGGYVTNPSYWKQWIDNAVNECGKRGIYVVIDFHVHIPGDPMTYISQATEFWSYMSAKHAGKNHVLYEICNEPSRVPWRRVKEYAHQVIPLIRANDPSTVILVGSSTWSQDVDSVAADPLPYDNLIYTLHFYNQGEILRRKANIAVSKGLPLFVSEYGTSNPANTEGPFYTEMEIWNAWMQDHGTSWINWTFSDKNEPSAALLPGSCGGNWNATSASGTWVKNKLKVPADRFVCNGDTAYRKKATQPFGGKPWPIPGKIEAENFDLGAQGLAYRDFTEDDSLSFYRPEAVDIVPTKDTGYGYSITDVMAGEWLNYTVQVLAAGRYDLRLRVSASFTGKTFHVKLDDRVISGTIKVPNTGAGKWATVTVPNLLFPAGLHDLQVHMDYKDIAFNYLQVVPAAGNASNFPPEVYLSLPLDRTHVNPPYNATIGAIAKDEDGTVRKVEFFSGSVKIGEDTTAPFFIKWNNVPSGQYTFYAQATDNKGAVSRSAPVQWTVQDLKPTVSILSPAAQDTINAPSFFVEVAAKDVGGSIAKVAFYLNDTLVSEDVTVPFERRLSGYPEGHYALRVVATDLTGNATSSSVVPLVLKGNRVNKRPAVQWAPRDTLHFLPGAVTLEAFASDGDGTVAQVAFYLGGTLLGTDAQAPYRFSWTPGEEGRFPPDRHGARQCRW